MAKVYYTTLYDNEKERTLLYYGNSPQLVDEQMRVLCKLTPKDWKREKQHEASSWYHWERSIQSADPLDVAVRYVRESYLASKSDLLDVQEIPPDVAKTYLTYPKKKKVHRPAVGR